MVNAVRVAGECHDSATAKTAPISNHFYCQSKHDTFDNIYFRIDSHHSQFSYFNLWPGAIFSAFNINKTPQFLKSQTHPSDKNQK